jgi:hypothetical protein
VREWSDLSYLSPDTFRSESFTFKKLVRSPPRPGWPRPQVNAVSVRELHIHLSRSLSGRLRSPGHLAHRSNTVECTAKCRRHDVVCTHATSHFSSRWECIIHASWPYTYKVHCSHPFLPIYQMEDFFPGDFFLHSFQPIHKVGQWWQILAADQVRHSNGRRPVISKREIRVCHSGWQKLICYMYIK